MPVIYIFNLLIYFLIPSHKNLFNLTKVINLCLLSSIKAMCLKKKIKLSQLFGFYSVTHIFIQHKYEIELVKSPGKASFKDIKFKKMNHDLFKRNLVF